jgi:uncharacterized membrane protein (UPF0127 family)
MTKFVRLLFILLLLTATACQGQNDEGSGDSGSDTPIEQPAPGDDVDDGSDDGANGDSGDGSGDDSPNLPTTPNGSTIALPEGVESIDFELGTVTITTDDASYTLTAEIAETPRQRQRGLMFRTSMPEDAGMMFVFQASQSGGFWMFNTILPLSIAYIDSSGTIVTIRDMEPCAGRTQTECSQEAAAYLASAPYRYALEVNQGYFDARDITVGDSVNYTTD